MNELLIARTKEKECCADDGVVWWKEFRLRRITSDDYYRLHIDAPLQPWLLEQRYICRLPDGRVVAKFEQGGMADAIRNPIDPDTVWVPWGLGKSPEDVVFEMLGDSSFRDADSLDDIHTRLVAKCRQLREAADELHRASLVRDAAHQAVTDFKRETEMKFYKAHGNKTGDAFEKAKERTLKRVMPEMDRLKAQAKVADQEFEKAEKKLAQLKEKK